MEVYCESQSKLCVAYTLWKEFQATECGMQAYIRLSLCCQSKCGMISLLLRTLLTVVTERRRRLNNPHIEFSPQIPSCCLIIQGVS